MANTHKKKIELDAQVRQVTGGQVKALRRSGFVPAVLYGKGQESISLQVPSKDFRKTLNAAGESTLVYLNVDGQAYPTIIKDVARDGISDEILHADFYKVRLDEKIKAMIPVVFEGEAPAVKDQIGVFVRNANELEVEALPQDLPHEITLSLENLKAVGDQITIKDINLGATVKIIGNPDELVAAIQAPMSEEELKAALEGTSESVEDVEEIDKTKEVEVPEEGEASAPAPEAAEEK